MALVEVDHLVKRFARGAGLFGGGASMTAVDDVSFAIEEGRRSGSSASPGAARRRPAAASCG
jgi:ABC-type oligopeptide transport system ATPase subunit